MSILENINSSADIKKLDREQLPQLCDELRKFEIENIAKTGGHLSPNLGTVELTVAIHRVYDTEKDRLVFDVGHQSYTHKIITGRREQFGTLRQYGGLSGFPKPSESNDDAFIAGHASNSVSVALGMARARTLTGGDYDIVSVIGDGALTGGLSHEGLADAAASGEPMVIILNDNNMSISENVGGMAQVLQNMRIKPAYISFKQWLKGVSENIPGLYKAFHVIKEWLKSRLLPGNVFSEMGLYYLGPVDGHDLDKLETAIRLARDVRKTVVLHVLTKKGKGCAYAESHPDKYHGIGRFDPETGELAPTAVSFSDKAGEYLCQYAENDPRIVAITAAMAGGTGTECFASKFPERFFDVGIAEGHGVTMAAGMAKQGLVPVFAVYSSFLQRGFDMLIHDVSLLGGGSRRSGRQCPLRAGCPAVGSRRIRPRLSHGFHGAVCVYDAARKPVLHGQSAHLPAPENSLASVYDRFPAHGGGADFRRRLHEGFAALESGGYLYGRHGADQYPGDRPPAPHGARRAEGLLRAAEAGEEPGIFRTERRARGETGFLGVKKIIGQ